MAVSIVMRASVSGSQTTALDLGTGTFPFSVAGDFNLANGTAANQADMAFTDRRTITASGTEDLDLAGSLLDAFGATMTFATIKMVFVKAAAANTNDVKISRPAANGFALFSAASDEISVKPGGVFMWAAPGAGVAVTAGTGDLLTFTNSAGGTSVVYDVIIVGTSA